jgi:hypothetical protein
VVGTLLANGIGPAVVGRRGQARVP